MPVANNLEKLEENEAEAAKLGPSALDSFKETELVKAYVTEKEEDLGSGSSGSSSDSDDSGDSDDSPDEGDSDGDSGDGGDSGGDSDPGDSDDFDFSGDDDGDEEESEEEPEEDDSEEEAEEEPEKEDEGDPGPPPEIKTESLRAIEPIPNDLFLRLEDGFLSKVSDTALQAWSGFTFVVTTLASVGLKYGPDILSGIFKVVLYTFARVFQLLGTIQDVCQQQINRYFNSTEKLSKRLNEVTKKINVIVKQNWGISIEDASKTFEVESVGGSSAQKHNLTRVIIEQSNFTRNVLAKILKGSTQELKQLKEIASKGHLSKNFDSMEFLNKAGSNSGLPAKDKANAPKGTRFYSLGIMPAGGFSCDLALPEASDNWLEIEKNYNNATFVFSGPPQSNGFTTATKEQLVSIANSLHLLLGACKEQKTFYEELKNSRTGLLTSTKAHFTQLVRAKTNVSYRESTALPLFLKTSIVTKVYLVASMDLQDHNTGVISNVIDFLEDSVKLYVNESGEEDLPEDTPESTDTPEPETDDQEKSNSQK